MIRRRELLGLGSAALASCARSEGAYFGRTVAPKTAKVVHILNGEVESLDPAKSTGSHEFYVIPALFEGLTQYHPELPIPMAGLATHYEANADCTQFRFYLRGHPAVNDLTVLVTRDLSTLVNQYRAGVAMLAYPAVPAIMPVLRRKKDFLRRRSYGSQFLAINTTTPPFNDVRARYALNMSIDKRPVSDLYGGGYIPALGLVPTTNGYQPINTLPVSIGGKLYDVLAFNPSAARELLSSLDKPLPTRIEYVIPNSPDDLLWAQVLKDQWRTNLGVELAILPVEFQTWIEATHNGNFRHLAEAGSLASYTDPAWFLDLFNSRSGFGTQWSDFDYAGSLAEAKATPDPSLRLARLGECERRLLVAMPILPLAHWVQAELRKPFVRGLGENLLDRQQFKYVWIDTNWRPQ